MADRLYLIEKRGLYHRPFGRGYTIFKREAGRFPIDEPRVAGERIWAEDEAPEYSSGAYPDQVQADLRRQLAASELTTRAWVVVSIFLSIALIVDAIL